MSSSTKQTTTINTW